MTCGLYVCKQIKKYLKSNKILSARISCFEESGKAGGKGIHKKSISMQCKNMCVPQNNAVFHVLFFSLLNDLVF